MIILAWYLILEEESEQYWEMFNKLYLLITYFGFLFLHNWFYLIPLPGGKQGWPRSSRLHQDCGNCDDHVTLICLCTMIMSLWFSFARYSCRFYLLLHKTFFIGLIPWNPPYVFIQCGVINKDPECALEYMMIMMIKRNYLKIGKPTPMDGYESCICS